MKAARSILGWPGFGDIRFWLAFFFVIRLYGITNPPLETSDNWRQTATLMVTRNYVEQGLDLLHPRVDTAGEKSGIVGMELPLLNLFHFLAGLPVRLLGVAWPADRAALFHFGGVGLPCTDASLLQRAHRPLQRIDPHLFPLVLLFKEDHAGRVLPVHRPVRLALRGPVP